MKSSRRRRWSNTRESLGEIGLMVAPVTHPGIPVRRPAARRKLLDTAAFPADRRVPTREEDHSMMKLVAVTLVGLVVLALVSPPAFAQGRVVFFNVTAPTENAKFT